MLSLVLLMLAGILFGAFIFSRGKRMVALKAVGKIQQAAAVLLLFAMGIRLGGDADFWSDVKTTGFHGFLFALTTIAGSILFVFVFSKILSRGQKS